MCVCMKTEIKKLAVNICTYLYIYIHIQTCTYIYIYIYMYNKYIYIHLHTHTQAHIYTYINTYISNIVNKLSQNINIGSAPDAANLRRSLRHDFKKMRHGPTKKKPRKQKK